MVRRVVVNDDLLRRATAQHAVDHRHEEQRGHGRHREAADDGAAQRRVLFAAFTQPERHRQHSDDHRHARSSGPGADGCSPLSEPLSKRVIPFMAQIVGEGDHAGYCWRSPRPIHMIAPMSDGTLKVVCVTKSIQTIPLSAPGSAMMMMNGSSHDWKLTTISR